MKKEEELEEILFFKRWPLPRRYNFKTDKSLTTIQLEKFKNVINISVTGINNILYLTTIPIYLDSLLRITQDPESTNVSITDINELCLQREIKDEEIIEEIVAPSERPYLENEQSSIIAQELVFDDDNKDHSWY